MPALIISDDEWLSQRLRQGLIQHGAECPPSHAVASELAGSFLGKAEIDLIVVVLQPDVERMMSMVTEVRAQSRAPILAVGPASDVKLVLRTFRGGASEYLDEADLEVELEEALRRCRDGDGARRNGQLVAVLGPCGGTGASSVAVNLAVALARKSGRSLLVDLKLATGDLAAMLDLKPTFTLADLCQQAGHLDRTMFQRSLVAHATGVHLLAPPHSLADLEYLTGEAVARTLTLARTLFPHVLVDLDRSFRQAQEPALRLADLVLVMLRLDFTCLRNTHRALDYLTELGVARDRVRIIVNRQGQPREITIAKAEQALGMKVFHCVPDDPKVMIQANNNGEPALLSADVARLPQSDGTGRHPACRTGRLTPT